jgi:hypothetical protein
MAGGGSNTSTSYTIPQNQYINDFVNQTVGMLGETQKTAPLYQFAQPQQRNIAGMSPLQQYAGSMIPQIAQGNPYTQQSLDLLGTGQAPQPMTDPAGINRYNNPRNATGMDYGVQPPMNFGNGQAQPMTDPGGITRNPANANNGLDYGVQPPMNFGSGQAQLMTGSEGPLTGGMPPWMFGGGGTQGTDPNSALGLLQGMTSGPIGSSPSTQAGMAAFQQNVLPTLQNELGAMGLGRSGIAGEQIQKAATSAAVPLIQQEIANRQAGIGQYGNIAQQMAGLGQQNLSNMGTAAGMATSLGGTQQQTAQASLDAPYQDWLRRQALAQSTTGLGGVPYQAPMQQVTQTPSPNFLGK